MKRNTIALDATGRISRFTLEAMNAHLKKTFNKLLENEYFKNRQGTFSAVAYRGKVHSIHTVLYGTPSIIAVPIHLHGEWDEYMNQIEKVKKDKTIIDNTLGSVITLCKTQQDLVNYLPDSLVNALVAGEVMSSSLPARTIKLEDIQFTSKFLRKNYIEVVIPKMLYYLSLKYIL